MGQKACSPICESERKRQRKLKQSRLEKLKTTRDYIKELEIAFNAYIRKRDSNCPCISCGKPLAGTYHAGHYRHAGSAKAVRFHEDNVHGQCIECNLHRHGNPVEYRIRLVQRIGVERVEALETSNGSVKWDVEWLKAKKEEYKKRAKEL